MPGTKEGAAKARQTVIDTYGEEFYKKIGAKGGKVSRGGFATNTIGKDGLTGSERARIAGAKGGKISKRKPKEKK